MANVIRVMLIVCAVLIVNGLFQLLRVAAKASRKDAARRGRECAKRVKATEHKATPTQEPKAPANHSGELPAIEPAKKRGRPRKEPASKPTSAAVSTEPKAEPVSMSAPMSSAGFSGEIVAFTGALECATREAAIGRVKLAGGKAYPSMPAGVTLLVVGDKPGKGKLDKARRWNIPTIDEDEFKRRCTERSTCPAIENPVPETLTLDEFAARIAAP